MTRGQGRDLAGCKEQRAIAKCAVSAVNARRTAPVTPHTVPLIQQEIPIGVDNDLLLITGNVSLWILKIIVSVINCGSDTGITLLVQPIRGRMLLSCR